MEPPSLGQVKDVGSSAANIPDSHSPAESPSADSANAQNGVAPPDLDFAGNVLVSKDLPSQADLEKCLDLVVTDQTGNRVPFRSLFTVEGAGKRHLVVFVRHFYCGSCQEYLRTLSSSITPAALSSIATPTSITVIGCGSPTLIPFYRDATSCPFPIYSSEDPSLYQTLGMIRSLDLGPKPNYIQSGLLTNIVTSIWQGVRQGPINAFKGGDVKQVGGEFLFENQGKRVVWCHRMRNTRDHTEVSKLRSVLGLDGSEVLIKRRWSRPLSELRRRSSDWARRPSWRKGSRDASAGGAEEEGQKTVVDGGEGRVGGKGGDISEEKK